MIVTPSIKKVREKIKESKKKGKTIGFVPTMGALHQGHLSLVKKARKECGFVAVSVFVNPIQFGPKEDYIKYPGNLKQDRALLKAEGVDLLFCPRAQDMYESGFSVYVDEINLSRFLCSKSRPGHFKGVCTVVAKLFNIVGPDTAYFGQKDYQQALIIKKLSRELNFPVKIKVLPTVREKDKLAMSSRNAYLSPKARKDSVCLYEALNLAKKLVKEGQRCPKAVVNSMRKLIKSRRSVKVDYIKIVNADSLRDVDRIKGKILVALAVYVGGTRLIDNIILESKK